MTEQIFCAIIAAQINDAPSSELHPEGNFTEVKKELSITEFEKCCAERNDARFCYNSGNNGGTECVCISLVFSPPSVIPNLGMVCFRNENGDRLTLAGVRKIYVMQNTSTGSDDYLFECQKGSAVSQIYLCQI